MKSIVESIDIFNDNSNLHTKFDGYTIRIKHGDKLDAINVKISNGQKCCEDWNVYSSLSDKNINNIIGSEILDISYIKPNDIDICDEDESAEIIVAIKYKLNNIDDEFKIYLYNHHNGYYSHECILNWNYYKNNEYQTFSTIIEL